MDADAGVGVFLQTVESSHALGCIHPFYFLLWSKIVLGKLLVSHLDVKFPLF
jgi:hypothetical protein